MDQVENAHPQRDSLLLAGFEADEEGVEGVRVPVGLDPDAGLADSAHAVRFRIPAPRQAQDQLRKRPGDMRITDACIAHVPKTGRSGRSRLTGW